MSSGTAPALPDLACFSVIDHYPPELYPGHVRTIAGFYEQVLEQCVLAEELGYRAFYVAEHHFDEYGVIPNPAVWLAAAAMRTRRIRLGPAVAVLPFRDPVHVAEDYAILDQLCRGRLVLPVGSGYLRHEFEGFNVDGASKRFRFDETLALIRALWRGEKVRYAGRYHALSGVALNVLPYGGRMPAMPIAVLRAEAAYHVGRAGEDLMTVPYATLDRFEDIRGLLDAYREGRAAGGHDRGRTYVALHTYVAETEQDARADAAAAFDLYVRTRKYAKRQTYDDIQRSGLSLMGSVETAADKLVALAEMGVDELMILYNFGDLPHALACASMRRMVDEVVPRAEARLGAARSRTAAAQVAGAK
jgi:alkanesulfonate monooxygenase SsuD/methylene tetrahydromethanopterin reductase-like flavin-dependent oxidoreductase (luciferase family)